LHIGFDAHSIGTGLGGNETYASNLIEALAEVDTQNRYTLYVTRQAAIDRYAHRWPNVTIRKTLPHTPRSCAVDRLIFCTFNTPHRRLRPAIRW
jgi:hypothetical protein